MPNPASDCSSSCVRACFASAALLLVAPTAAPSWQTDEFSWLNEARAPRALEWVKQENERTARVLKADPRYREYFGAALAARKLENQDPIVSPKTTQLLDGWLYQVVQNQDHPRGLWRRTTLESYVTRRPQWQALIDVDALSREEGRQYQLSLFTCAPRSGRCMVSFNEGASPRVGAGGYREFDVEMREFVRDGFFVPADDSKALIPQFVAWENGNTLWVATDFGPGTLSENALPAPLTIRRWQRGQSLTEAQEIFRMADDPRDAQLDMRMAIPARVSDERGREHIMATVVRGVGGQECWTYDEAAGFNRLPLPDDMVLIGARDSGHVIYRDELVFSIRSDWTVAGKTWPAASLLSVPLHQAADAPPKVRVLRAARPKDEVPMGAVATPSGVFAPLNLNGRNELWFYTFAQDKWRAKRVPFPQDGVIAPILADPTQDLFLTAFESLVQAPTEYAVRGQGTLAEVKQHRASFDVGCCVLERLETRSQDGTVVPYFLVRPKKVAYNGQAPTLLYGYGAFGNLGWPNYDATLGALWLKQGGLYVMVNTRGDGLEGSPHPTRAQRHLVYEDFIAVAEDLIRRKITSPRKLGIYGTSAGGLLMGVMATQRPELFNAIVIHAPVLDLFWSLGRESEFGDPGVSQDRAFMERTSPFQNLRGSLRFPTPLIMTSTTDDNVPPAMARRFAAKAAALGLPYLFWEAAEGGHGGAFTPEQAAEQDAWIYLYLTQRLMDAR